MSKGGGKFIKSDGQKLSTPPQENEPTALKATTPERPKNERPHLKIVETTPGGVTPTPPHPTSPNPGGERVSEVRSKSGVRSGLKKVRSGTHLERTLNDHEQVFRAVRYLICRGAIRPSHTQIKSVGVGSTRATQFLDRLRNQGVIERAGRGHDLVSKYAIPDGSAKIKPEFEKLIAA